MNDEGEVIERNELWARIVLGRGSPGLEPYFEAAEKIALLRGEPCSFQYISFGTDADGQEVAFVYEENHEFNC